MARMIKRLSYRSNPSSPTVEGPIKRDSGSWEKELKWWSGIGIDTVLLRVALDGSGVGRSIYEDQLQARIDRSTDEEIRHARYALKRAGPLIRLLKTKWALDGPPDLFFGDLGEEVERSVQTYIETRRPALPAHRPDEPWLIKGVLRLARPLRASGQSWRETYRALHRIFTLAGHDDIVTAEKIRHIIRNERKRDSTFGSDGPATPAVLAWFKKSAPVSAADWAAWTATPLNASRRGRPRRRKGRRVVNR
jgi:hypothetical protein